MMLARKLLFATLLSALVFSGWALASAVFETASAQAEIKMSKPDTGEMRKKSQDLNSKARTRNQSATERMRRILLEKRDGKRGFSNDFNTIPGDKKR